MFIKTLSCCARGFSACSGGFVDAHHAGERAYGRKADDDTCIPLCRKHHNAWHLKRPPFRAMTPEERRRWADTQIGYHRTLYEKGWEWLG